MGTVVGIVTPFAEGAFAGIAVVVAEPGVEGAVMAVAASGFAAPAPVFACVSK